MGRKWLNRVLILEDEPFIAIDLEEMLRDAGADEIITFANCLDADAWLISNTPDVAIVDPNLKDGFSGSAVKTLATRNVPFLVYSGDAASLLEKEPAFGAGKWLSKPCLPEVLVSAVASCMAGFE